MESSDTTVGQKMMGSIASDKAAPAYGRPLAIVTTLFFMWGLLTSLNDILVPHLKSIFDLSYTRAMLIQFAFFSAYFLFSVPWSKVVTCHRVSANNGERPCDDGAGRIPVHPRRIGRVVPAVSDRAHLLAAGITGLQVAANPYVVGARQTRNGLEPARLTQAFNSLGTTIGPKLGGLLILSAAPLADGATEDTDSASAQAYRIQEAASVKMPYTVVGIALLLLAVLDRRFAAAKDRARGGFRWRRERQRLDLESSQPYLWPRSDFHLCRRRSLDRQLSGQLFRLAGYRRPCGEDGGRVGFVLLGRRHDRPLCRRAILRRFKAGYVLAVLRHHVGVAGYSLDDYRRSYRRCGASWQSACSTRSCSPPSSALARPSSAH